MYLRLWRIFAFSTTIVALQERMHFQKHYSAKHIYVLEIFFENLVP